MMGPAGSGKSSYCATIVRHCENAQRRVSVVNLDPAAEHFDYVPAIDIRELIHLDDVMEDEDLRFGPNGGLVYCLEYLVKNMDWLEDQLGEDNDDYILFDCPGQIELYTHLDIMPRLIACLTAMEFRICAVYLLDCQFLLETSKFISGVMTALCSMVKAELPHVNVLTKLDLLNKRARKQLERYLDPDLPQLLEEEQRSSVFGQKYSKLTRAIASLIDSYSLVSFYPLNSTKPESIEELLITVDNAIQYGEDLDVKVKEMERDLDSEDGDNDEDANFWSRALHEC